MSRSKFWHRALHGGLSAELDWLAMSLIGGGYLQQFQQPCSRSDEERDRDKVTRSPKAGQ